MLRNLLLGVLIWLGDLLLSATRPSTVVHEDCEQHLKEFGLRPRSSASPRVRGSLSPTHEVVGEVYQLPHGVQASEVDKT
jgi:hypothetical protein